MLSHKPTVTERVRAERRRWESRWMCGGKSNGTYAHPPDGDAGPWGLQQVHRLARQHQGLLVPGTPQQAVTPSITMHFLELPLVRM